MCQSVFRLLHFHAVFLFCITLLHLTTLANAATTTVVTRTIAGHERDRAALLAFRSKIHDPRGVMRWWNESRHFCEWKGVTCSRRHGRVTVLDLMSSGLVGSLSPYIGNLSFLREIRLRNNTFQGRIPDEVGRLFRLEVLGLSRNSLVGEIPANLSHCSKLKSLELGYNKLVGKIPLELASLSSLKTLIIHGNNLMGGIPPFIGNLTSLQALSAAYNALGGNIPDSLGRLENLISLGLGGNNLYGTIPTSIYNLSFLVNFSISENQLHGSLPPNLGLTLPHLQWFQLSLNLFGGSIPVSLSNASKLEVIDMFGNNFSGKLAVDFGGMQHLSFLNFVQNNLGSGEADEMSFIKSLANCSKLDSVYLSQNQFRGALPHSIANLTTQLQRLLIDRNQFHGHIPSGIGNLVNLYLLGMEHNQFTGTIPTEMGKLQNLQWIGLHHNKLSGKIPSFLGNLSSLAELHLNNNKLRGPVLSSLGKLPNLAVLNLFQNELTGTIPKQIFDMPHLSLSLNLAQNHLVGSIPPNVGNLIVLMELDVSENNLSGEIPTELGHCTHLEKLDMEGNFFQGSLPQSLSSLRGIRRIDLSRNNFSGQIPEFLESLSLEKLNLSFNDFEGDVPMKGIFTNPSAISVVGNKRLCGGIPTLQLPKCTINHSEKQKMSLVHKLLISTACAFLGVTVVSALVFRWFKRKREKLSSEPMLRKELWKVSYERLLKATDGFANLIGVGSFGSVYKGILHQDETIVAVKVLNLQRRGASRSFMAECKALRNIRHRNLVRVLTSCSSVDFQGNNFKALVYEYMANGSLEDWLHPVPEIEDGQVAIRKLSLLQRINIAVDVASALDYLHHHCREPVLHCDLKPSNVLLDTDMTAHVGDFGLARFLPQRSNPNQSSSVGVRGTIGYAPPEYGLGSEVSTNGDVYSYGILLLEMVTRKKPTDNMFEGDLNLHNFARMALPDRVVEIVDPRLLNDDEVAADNRRLGQATNKRKKECVIALVKIGVACSMESPQERLDIGYVIHELHSVRDSLLEPETQQHIRRG